jgi:hypothetical protein
LWSRKQTDVVVVVGGGGVGVGVVVLQLAYSSIALQMCCYYSWV